MCVLAEQMEQVPSVVASKYGIFLSGTVPAFTTGNAARLALLRLPARFLRLRPEETADKMPIVVSAGAYTAVAIKAGTRRGSMFWSQSICLSARTVTS